MPPVNARYNRSESAFHQNLTTGDREELLKLQTLRDIPKSKYATQSCLTGIPSGRGRKVIYSHVEIYKNVEEIATDLREAGVRPQTVCAFILQNSIEAVVYFQALQWIGAIAVPIDPDLSEDEIALVLKQADAFTVVSRLVDEDEQATDALFQKIRAACSTLGIIEWYIARSTNRGVFLERKNRRAGEGAAWSGGAGDFKYEPSETSIRFATPDGNSCLTVDVTHRSITTATREYSNTYNLTSEMSNLLIFPFHSVHGLISVLASMYSGGCVAIREGPVIDAHDILALVSEYKVNWFAADPDAILSLYNDVTREPTLLKNVNLSFIRSIDGTIDANTMKIMEPTLRAPVLEAYGTQETCGMISASRETDFRPGTSGQIVNGCEVIILDASRKAVAPGTVGAIAARGIHISKEFIGSKGANEERFVEVAKGDGFRRYFLTGDEGYLSSDGYLTITSDARSRRKALLLATQGQEEKISAKDGNAASRALELAAEEKKMKERRQIEEAEKLRQKQKEEQDEIRKLAEERRLLEERESEKARLHTEQSEVKELESIDQDEDEDSPSQNASRSVSLSHRSARIDEDMLNMIMERLDAIERNQRRLEEDIEAGHRAEMEKLRALMEKYEERQPASPVSVNMDAINSAVNAAAASAQSSSRDTAAAAQAAKDAAEAAQAARAVALVETSPSVVEVADPNAVQKTVLVSLDDVEEAMKVHPSVETARAFGRPDKKYGMEVFCAIKPKAGARVSEPWLKLHAQTVLAAAFVPKQFFYKEDLTEDAERAALSKDNNLKRMSEYAGFKSSSKKVRQPEWTPTQAKEALVKAARGNSKANASGGSGSKSELHGSGAQAALASRSSAASAREA